MAGITVQPDTLDLGTLEGDIRCAAVLILRGMSDGLRDGHRQYLRDNLDSPTTYTENFLYVVGTTVATPEIVGGIKDQQASYLQYAYEGGHRDRAVVPTLDAPLDTHGNLPRGYMR